MPDGRVKLDFAFDDGTRFGFETSYAFAHEITKTLASTVEIAAANAMVDERAALCSPSMATMDELAQTITDALRARGIRDITGEDFPTWYEGRVQVQDHGAILCVIRRKHGVHKIGCWLLNLEQTRKFAQWLANAPASYDIDGAMEQIT